MDEKKSHRTKAELNQRRAEEQAILTGIKMHEAVDVKDDPAAHKEFRRVIKILGAVGKNDALYEAVINTYCRYESDIERYARLREQIENDAEMKSDSRYKLILECDGKIDKFRRKRFDIEKENGMTIASSARAIPKTINKPPNPLLDIL
ncbi:MAG: hypothetical protein VB039_05170 [Oscillospiraceae bacterium]|nr:hypothetical protein [Oscillospiraceae bacterium]